MRNKFIDPKTAAEYSWAINHDEEEEVGRSRNIQHTANTANTGLVRQQGAQEPLELKYSGTILTLAQLQYMWAWFALCESQTIWFQDFENNVYEVTISAFHPVRKRVARNPRDLTNAPLHIWDYTIEMDVIRVRSGPLAGYVDA